MSITSLAAYFSPAHTMGSVGLFTEGMADCFRAFGWNATVIDGTDMKEIYKAVQPW